MPIEDGTTISVIGDVHGKDRLFRAHIYAIDKLEQGSSSMSYIYTP